MLSNVAVTLARSLARSPRCLWDGVSPKAGFAMRWCPRARGQMFLARPRCCCCVLDETSCQQQEEAKFCRSTTTCFSHRRRHATSSTRSLHRRLTRCAARESAGGCPRSVQGRLQDGVHHNKHERFRHHTSTPDRARRSPSGLDSRRFVSLQRPAGEKITSTPALTSQQEAQVQHPLLPIGSSSVNFSR